MCDVFSTNFRPNQLTWNARHTWNYGRHCYKCAPDVMNLVVIVELPYYTWQPQCQHRKCCLFLLLHSISDWITWSHAISMVSELNAAMLLNQFMQREIEWLLCRKSESNIMFLSWSFLRSSKLLTLRSGLVEWLCGSFEKWYSSLLIRATLVRAPATRSSSILQETIQKLWCWNSLWLNQWNICTASLDHAIASDAFHWCQWLNCNMLRRVDSPKRVRYLCLKMCLNSIEPFLGEDSIVIAWVWTPSVQFTLFRIK